MQPNAPMWEAFEVLGLTDRYEGIVASVGYERIESYVRETYSGSWEKPCLEALRHWMSVQIVPWMLPMYAKGAVNSASFPAFLPMIALLNQNSGRRPGHATKRRVAL
jgi:hypothetical protein